MGMLDLLMGRKAQSPAKPRNSRPAQNSIQFEASQLSPQSVTSVRKDVLRLVLRELLTRNGIPQGWVAADMLRTTTSSKRQEALHVRFLVRRWEPRLLEHGPAIEQEFAHRLLILDPQAREWLSGFSWQFVLEDTRVCPPLPHPGSWTAPSAPPQEEPVRAPLTKPGDIIEGPMVLPRTSDEVRADLEQLLALRDADQKRHAQGGDHFAATRPATL